MNFPKESRSLSCLNTLEKSTLFILMRIKSQFYIIHAFAASENFSISSTKHLISSSDVLNFSFVHIKVHKYQESGPI